MAPGSYTNFQQQQKNPSDVIFLNQDGLIFLAFKPCKILTPDTHVRNRRTEHSPSACTNTLHA